MKKGFIIGLATGLTVAGVSVALASSHIQALLNEEIKVTLNGQVQEFKDEITNETQYPITYHDRTYLPLRTVANLVGVDVDYDASSNTAILSSNNDLEIHDSDDIFIKNAKALGLGKLMYRLASDAYNGLSISYDKTPYLTDNGYPDCKILNINYFKELFSQSKFQKFVNVDKDNSNHWNGTITYKNGDYYYTEGTGGGPSTYIASDLKIKSISENKIVYDAYTFDRNDGLEPTYNNGDEIDKVNVTINSFVLIKENGKWKVDDFILTNPPYIDIDVNLEYRK